MSIKRTQQAPTGQYEIVREPGSLFVDVWYICGHKRERIAADISESEALDAMMDDTKYRDQMRTNKARLASMGHDPYEFYRTMGNEELQGVIARMEERERQTTSHKKRQVAMGLAEAAREILKKRGVR